MAVSCSLAFRIARTDFPFIESLVPHLVRACQFDFADRFVVVDTAPLSGDFLQRPGVGSLDEIFACCNRFIAAGVIDRVVPMDYSEAFRRQVYGKHFGRDLRFVRDYRGSTVLGSLVPIEAARTDYLVYFDSDLLLYQQAGFSWIERGIELLQQHEDILVVTPLSGPPAADGRLQQRGIPYSRDAARGIYQFKEFTNRKFLIDRRRFASILPIAPRWVSWKRRLASTFTNRSALLNWESMLSQHLETVPYIRAELMSPQAWTLHTPDHGATFIENLPTLVDKVEAGWYPREQAGDYDLQLDRWLSPA